MIANYNIFDWHWINYLVPFVGLIGCSIMFFSQKTCTAGKAVSTAVSLSMIMWLSLIWADWGSAVFEPSRQTMAARVLIIIISFLIMFELRRATITRFKNTRLIKILERKNNSLIEQNQKLKTLLKQAEQEQLDIPTTSIEKDEK